MAMIFNDFKGLVLLNDSMRAVYRPPEGTEISGHTGELEGISVQIIKLFLSTLHEAMEFVHESKSVFESRYIQNLLETTSGDTKLVWEMLNKVSHGEPVNDERFAPFSKLRDLLENARNNIGFHYQTRKRLIDGYRKFFFRGISNVGSRAREYAYRSTKNSEFLTSRYYYADAALQGYYVNLFGDEKLAKQRIDESFQLLNMIAYAIHDLLLKYHESLPNR